MLWKCRYIVLDKYKLVALFPKNLTLFVNQLLPEQAASYVNYASRAAIPSYRSPKGVAPFPLPGHESFPENNSSIKMYVYLISARHVFLILVFIGNI